MPGAKPLISCSRASHFSLFALPYFRHVAGASIPMRVLNAGSEHRWETEMAKEVFEPFSGDEAPLVRTVLIHDPDRSIFIIAAHRSISDGMSMTVVLCDL